MDQREQALNLWRRSQMPGDPMGQELRTMYDLELGQAQRAQDDVRQLQGMAAGKDFSPDLLEQFREWMTGRGYEGDPAPEQIDADLERAGEDALVEALLELFAGRLDRYGSPLEEPPSQ